MGKQGSRKTVKKGSSEVGKGESVEIGKWRSRKAEKKGSYKAGKRESRGAR